MGAFFLLQTAAFIDVGRSMGVGCGNKDGSLRMLVISWIRLLLIAVNFTVHDDEIGVLGSFQCVLCTQQSVL